eukprot:5788549-Alexandrium_andersonii.AAC.1
MLSLSPEPPQVEPSGSELLQSEPPQDKLLQSEPLQSGSRLSGPPQSEPLQAEPPRSEKVQPLTGHHSASVAVVSSPRRAGKQPSVA